MAIDLEKLERLAAQATPGPWVGRGNHIFCANNKRLVYVEAERVLDLQTAAYIVDACNSLPTLIAENRALQEKVRELELDRELYRERLYESWNQTEQCIELLHDAGVNLTKWACGVESCQGCDIPECDMGDLDMVEKYSSRKAIAQAAKEAVE